MRAFVLVVASTALLALPALGGCEPRCGPGPDDDDDIGDDDDSAGDDDDDSTGDDDDSAGDDDDSTGDDDDSAAEPAFTLLWAGDTLVGDRAQPDLDAFGYDFPFEFLGPQLQADYSIFNAESPITELSEPYDDARWTYNALPPAAEALANAGFDAAGFANNHTMDRGGPGVVDTIEYLADEGVATFGGGEDCTEAALPLFVDTPHGRVAVVGLANSYGAARTAGPDQAGTLVLDRANAEAGLELALDGGADHVVAYVHWGRNYSHVRSEQREKAALLVETGYDLVVGHGAHVQQVVELIEGVPVIYSLGNFVFGTSGRFSEDFPGYAVLLTSSLDERGFSELSFSCLLTNNAEVQYQPRPCPPGEAAEVLFGLHPELEMVEENRGILSSASLGLGPG